MVQFCLLACLLACSSARLFGFHRRDFLLFGFFILLLPFGDHLINSTIQRTPVSAPKGSYDKQNMQVKSRYGVLKI